MDGWMDDWKERNFILPLSAFRMGGIMSVVSKQICQYLRTKASYVPSIRTETYLTESDSTAVYWCIKTMTPIGPDDSLACPEDCKSNRECFEQLG